jgi:hypothetical protein
VKTLPAVRESIELRRWHEVDGHIATVARVLDEYAAAVDEAVSVLESR